MAKTIERIVAGTATSKDRQEAAEMLATFSRTQLKFLHEVMTGSKVFGLKDEIIDQVREALLADEE